MSVRAVRLLYCGEVALGPRPLRDRGHEVVALEPTSTAAEVAAVAVQEDVGLVAVADPELGAEVAELLDEDVVVFSITSATGAS